MQMRNRQAGLTLIGFLFVAAVVVVIALKAVAGALDDAVDGQPATVRRFFERRISADYVESVRWQDLEVTKQNNQIVGTISWERRMPLVYNVSLLLDFEVTEAR